MTATIAISILGASNSVLKRGYVASLPDLLRAGGREATIHNHSVGATPCLRGTIPILQGDTRGADVVVLEYTITDQSLFRRHGERLWADYYETLMRHARRAHPDAHVLCLILGRRDARYRDSQDRMRRTLGRLADRYDVTLVDFDAHLHDLHPKPEAFAALYRDSAHFTEPEIPRLCASILATAILSGPAERAETADPIPHTLYTDGMKVLDLADRAGDLETDAISNAMLTCRAVRLPIGATMTLPGAWRPLALEYLSRPDAADLVLTRGGHSTRYRTLSAEVRNGRFKLLLRFLPMPPDAWQDADAADWTLRAVSSHAPGGPGEAQPEATEYYGMVPSEPQSEAAVHLVRLLYLDAAADGPGSHTRPPAPKVGAQTRLARLAGAPRRLAGRIKRAVRRRLIG